MNYWLYFPFDSVKLQGWQDGSPVKDNLILVSGTYMVEKTDPH